MAIHTFSTLTNSDDEALVEEYKKDCKKKGIVYSARFREAIVAYIKKEREKDEQRDQGNSAS